MLEVYVEGRPLPFASVPTYLGVKMDRSLTYHHHLESLKIKVASRVALIRKLAGTTWGADAATLRISVLAFVFSTAEYCAPVWCHSSHTHMLDSELNRAMHVITGYIDERNRIHTGEKRACASFSIVFRRYTFSAQPSTGRKAFCLLLSGNLEVNLSARMR